MSFSIQIRKEIPEDYRAVYELNSLAFEQEGESKLVDALRKNKSVFVPELSLVAVLNQTVIGHILFSKIQIISEQDQIIESLALAPMAVLPNYQKQGIGSDLVRKGLEIATEMGFQSVIVLGHEKYYPKFGFVPAEKWGIKTPFDVPSSYFMALELSQNGLQDSAGMVQYPKEFDGV